MRLYYKKQSHRQLSLILPVWLAVLIIFGYVLGCKRAPSVQPSTAKDTIKSIVQRLENNEPQVLWESMPPSYQADMRTLIGEFCSNMDPEIYDRMFRILNKGVRVLREKREFFYKSPYAISNPMIENMMGDRWNQMVSLLNSIATSELASLDSLRRIDPGRFLETTGQEVMSAMDQMRKQFQRTPGPNPLQKLSEALNTVQFQPSGQDRGWLRFGSTNKMLKDVELVRVDGKWIPQPIADAWKDRLVKAKEGLGKLNGEEVKKMKPMITLLMNSLDNSMDSMLKASNQKEFDNTLKGLSAIGAMVSSMKPKPQ